MPKIPATIPGDPTSLDPAELFRFSEYSVPRAHQKFQFIGVRIASRHIVRNQHGRSSQPAVTHLKSVARLGDDDFVPPHFDSKVGHRLNSQESGITILECAGARARNSQANCSELDGRSVLKVRSFA